MHNSQPSQTPYRASRSNTFFVVVLLMALFLAVMPFAYALVEIPPSLACGPFQRFGATWDVVRFTVRSWGWPLVDIVNFFTSVAFCGSRCGDPGDHRVLLLVRVGSPRSVCT
uniref:Putative transmembrane channel-like protein 7 n=1 Tax=Ixodes ricinus TaxID=34613 RepID=A0A0K8R6D5_IXORI